MLAQGAEHGVRDIAYAGLDRQEAFRHAAGSDLGRQKLGHVLPNFHGNGGGGGEPMGLIVRGGLDHAGNAGRDPL